ncbi:MAG: hypothetical protein RBR54_05850 [Sulfurimonas sp.]|jgi:hypothetical protein|nr:hypothetical protein [Sulfurimonas sp.]
MKNMILYKMFKNLTLNNALSKEEKAQIYFDEATKLCEELTRNELQGLNICGYTYTTTEAVNELGLDDELVNQLVEDYVIQILKTASLFAQHLQTLHEAKQNSQELDYTPLRELAHKNLGVARNLRIRDGEALLHELMIKDDLEYLDRCLHALKACAIRLKPLCAFNTLKLMEVKSII